MRWLSLAVVAGCGFGATPGMNTGDDVPPEAGPDVPDGCVSFSTLYDTCVPPPSGTPAALDVPAGTSTYDTGTNTLRLGNVDSNPPHVEITGPSGAVDVVFFTTVTIPAGASLRVFGPRAVLIVASGAVQIDGTLQSIGPGAGSRTDEVCALSAGQPGAPDAGGGGGGGGGAFQGAGGAGGKGNLNGVTTAGGAGGMALTPRPAGLTGGCDGGKGGENGGAGGDGGGAIGVASAVQITVGAMGAINVGGSGGKRGGMNNHAGGGGGAGGMIVLEAGIVRIDGAVAANGGGGGEGDTNNAAGDGEDGKPSAQPAAGGDAGDANGGNGGPGGAGAMLDGVMTADVQDGGGGGGGGGAGYISIRAATPMIFGVVSPASQP